MSANEKTPLLHSGSEKSKLSSEPGIAFKPLSEIGDGEKDDALVPMKTLFRFSDSTDYILISLAVFGCLVYGFLNNAQFIAFGDLMNDMIDYAQCERIKCEKQIDLEARTTDIALWYIGFALGNFFFSWMGFGLFAISAERQSHKIRLAVFRSAIYQNIGWFDKYSAGEINTRLTEDINKISDGIGSKFGRLLSCTVTFISGYCIGFYYVWQVTLVLLGAFPLIVFVGGLMAMVTSSQTTKELHAYAKAGFVAEQSVSSIRTVAAFGGEQKQAELYGEQLHDASKFGVTKGLVLGLGMGAFQLVLLSIYSIGLWYLIRLSKNRDAEPGDGMTAFFAATTASLMLGQVGPSAESLAAARGAAKTVFQIIDRQSEIDASSNEGIKPAVINGDVEFSNIQFVYPTRTSVRVLNKFNLKVPSGKRVALVGESGCGKSTVIKLVQRFYDPSKGAVLVDGQDIKSFNVRHVRNFIGVVNQEPVLFATTIAENIAYGHEGVTQQEIEEAAKIANAHNFITQFPQGYDTFCGERGAKMSGGQKQRIAIARALIRNPKILLLDEATSALDTESEAVVQAALDKAGEGRTTIVIAHRLSTIRNADIIVALNKGRVAEMGTHEELMALDGIYNTLVKVQGVDDRDEEDDKDDDDYEKAKAKELAISSLATTATTGTHHATEKLQDDDDDDAELPVVTFGSILKLSAPEWKYILVGCFGAGLHGAYPFLFSLSFSRISEILSYDPDLKNEREDMEDDGKFWSLSLFFIGIASGIGVLLQNYYFAKAGEALTKRLRKQTFLAFLRQNIAYYDKPSHGTGAICTRLASEVSSIQGATGAQIGLVFSAIVTLTGGFIVAFTATWKITLVMLAFLPVLFISGLFLNQYLGGASETKITSSEAGMVAEETLSNIQTVVSLGQEETFFEKYRSALASSHKKAIKMSHISGLANGAVMGIVNISFAAGFRYGGYLVVEEGLTLKDMMRSIITIIMCALNLGQLASMTPDYASAKRAARRVFHLIEKVPDIDSYSDAGKTPEKCKGELELSSVRFRYPTRLNSKVLRNVSFCIKPGQTVALVGPSGSGKSTSVSLVERFYDVGGGSVRMDGEDVKDLNLKWLRSQIGIVSQEPVLFDLSIRDNIAYGDNTRSVSNGEIEQAAKSANIHDFISSLPQGYDTKVGDKGTLISGGQKQRIAIARALIRDPKILLLDEATSALDTESEKVVQQALDKASEGRTTLVIAHRLSTIQNADVICVIKGGKIVEEGTHQQLLALKGIYFALHKAQSKNNSVD